MGHFCLLNVLLVLALMWNRGTVTSVSHTVCLITHYTGRQRFSMELQMELVQLEELCKEQEGNICNKTRVQVAGGQSTSRSRVAQLLSCAKRDCYSAVAAWIGSECLRQILGLLVLVFISCKMGSTVCFQVLGFGGRDSGNEAIPRVPTCSYAKKFWAVCCC